MVIREAPSKPLRVVVVDDSEDIRALLTVQFSTDDRFMVVGQGANGREAVMRAAAEQPDLLILDQEMPVMNGLEAIPEIRAVSPDTAIVLYTAQDASRSYQAALDAGALQVLEKVALGRSFVDRLVDSLVERAAAEDATIEIHVGPVSGHAARVWIENSRKIIEAVASRPDVIGEPIPDDILDLFRSFLDQWGVVAATADEFKWVARSHPQAVERVVTSWAAIDAMTDDQLAELGISWAPPEAAPFFESLTAGVLEAMRRHDETKRLAERVGAQFDAYLDNAR